MLGIEENIDNRARILQALWRLPGRSRVDLAALLNLDKSTLSRSAGRMIDAGMLEEAETMDAGPRGGRRPVGLSVRGDWGAWLGLEVQPEAARGVLVDLAGTVRGEFVLTRPAGDWSLAGTLQDARDGAFRTANREGVPLRGVHIAVPGAVRPGSGIIERSRPLGIGAPWDLAWEVGSAWNLPATVDNDANCCCRGEQAFHDGPVPGNFLFLLSEARRKGLALGLGTVIDGKIHLGDHGASGEFLSVFRSDGLDQLSLGEDALSRAAEDPGVLETVARELAPQLALLANALDIDCLVLGGLMRTQFDRIAPILTETLVRRRTYPDIAATRVIPSRRGDDAVAYGAAVRFTEELAQPSTWRTL